MAFYQLTIQTSLQHLNNYKCRADKVSAIIIVIMLYINRVVYKFLRSRSFVKSRRLWVQRTHCF